MLFTIGFVAKFECVEEQRKHKPSVTLPTALIKLSDKTLVSHVEVTAKVNNSMRSLRRLSRTFFECSTVPLFRGFLQ